MRIDHKSWGRNFLGGAVAFMQFENTATAAAEEVVMVPLRFFVAGSFSGDGHKRGLAGFNHAGKRPIDCGDADPGGFF